MSKSMLKSLFAILLIFFIVFSISNLVNLPVLSSSKSPEMSLSMFSPLSKLKSKVVAASCGFSPHGGPDEFESCTVTINCCYGGPKTVTGVSQCGGVCSSPDSFGSNGGTNGTPLQADVCSNHPDYNKNCSSGVDPCGRPISGKYDQCGVCVPGPSNVQSCSVTNACGQTFTGYQCPGGCTAGNDQTDINNSCIKDFRVTTNSVNPGGSVEFFWTFDLPANIQPRCDFVDLTTPTPRPIPGLQNLDPTLDRARITNIQTTTRFCLVCQFINLLTNNEVGNTAVHQWIRVIRIGEN